MPLHPGIEWADVKKSLFAERAAIGELAAWNANGHRMTVAGLHNGKFTFVSAWTNVEEVAAGHRDLVYDPQAEAWLRAHRPTEKCNGSVIAIIMATMGVEEEEAGNYLASREFQEHFLSAL